MFLHGSWSHVLGNMWYLWIFGDNVEDRVGHGRFMIFYLLCGIAAALGQIVIDPKSTLPTIGASGAIAGVMGAYFVLYPQSRVLTLIPLIIFWESVELPAIFLLGVLVPDAAVQRRGDRRDREHARQRRRRVHGARRRLRDGADWGFRVSRSPSAIVASGRLRPLGLGDLPQLGIRN